MAKAILRQHTRASSSTKVSSLYLFDAIARHAKDIVKKNGVGFDANDARAPAGSDAIDGTVEALISGASNFLAAASEVASELALDTVKSVSREQQVSVGTHPSFFLLHRRAAALAARAAGRYSWTMLIHTTAWPVLQSKKQTSIQCSRD